MINKRLINTVESSKKYIFGNIIFQMISLVANIIMMSVLAFLFGTIYNDTYTNNLLFKIALIVLSCILCRVLCQIYSSKMSYLASKEVKFKLRPLIYNKVVKLGASYKEKLKTSEIVQLSVEGVEQLEIYFAAYLPQFFYAMLAPLVLFIYISFIDLKSAIVLFVCVPLIPISIALVQTIAKKLLEKYWGKYTALGDTFLENLQGLTTLKIYQSDEYQHKKMNEDAEHFRKITMKVLTMQLNSITIMDLIAFGGSAFGVLMSVKAYMSGNIDIAQAFIIILLSADFFIPMRLLGSFFHIAMNGIAASKKIFYLIDLPENVDGSITEVDDGNISLENVFFSYNEEREILKNININFERGKLTALVGESGSGKSTIASILTGKNKNFKGKISISGIDIRDIKEEILLKHITYVGHNAYLFNKSVRDNLLIAKMDASDEELWNVLKKTKLDEFIKSENGLDTIIKEKASNLSGGQAQRLALARALLHNSDVYIFDEATSNIDVESENDIINLIYEISKEKTVILISHRLFNVKNADKIFVLEKGKIVEEGTHNSLVNDSSCYKKMWTTQAELESYRKVAE